MGTKVQLKSHPPEICNMRDLNHEAGSSWSQYYVDRASGGQLNNHAQQTQPSLQSNRYLVFDKESIKQTMIAQDATFKNQIRELHRLYNRQNELVHELKKKDSYGYLQADTSRSNSYSSQIPLDGINMMRHITNIPEASSTYNKLRVTSNDDKKFPLNILNGSSSHSINSRRLIDLQLPADAYIDCEDAKMLNKETVAEPSSLNMFSLNGVQVARDKDLKFALETSESFNYREKTIKPDPCMNGAAAHCLVDLNEPVKESFLERAASSVSYDFLGTRTIIEDKQAHQLLPKSDTSVSALQSAFFRAMNNEDETHHNHFLADKKEINKEWPFFNNNPGQTPSIRALFSPSEQPQQKFKKPPEIPSPNPDKDIWYKQNNGIVISDGHVSHPTPNPFSASHIWDWKKSTDSYCQNGFNNAYKKPISFGNHEVNNHKCLNIANGNKLESSSGILSWLKPNTSIIEFDFSKGYPQLKTSCSTLEKTQEASISSKKLFGVNIFENEKAKHHINLNCDPDEDDTLAKEAAENILWMLSSNPSLQENPSDILSWFADIVSTTPKVNHEDEFEKTTLELEETKTKELFLHIQLSQDYANESEPNIAESLLFTKPRGRKRRQRRDFQKDILPGLATLSRLEVTEDMQMFAALVKEASGESWQYGAKKRNSRKTAARAQVHDNAGTIVGWGRTTRRCRRQRGPQVVAVNNVAASIT